MFKVIALSMGYILDQWIYFLHTCMDISLGLDFGDHDIVFNVTVGLKYMKNSLKVISPLNLLLVLRQTWADMPLGQKFTLI